jgi:hypothetical protein
VIARLRVSAGARAIGSLGFGLALLLLGHGPLAAQESALYLVPAPAEGDCGTSSQTAYRLLPEQFGDHERWLAFAGLDADAPLKLELGRPRPTGTSLTSSDALSFPATEPVSSTAPCPTHPRLAADSTESPPPQTLTELTAELFPTRFDQAHIEVPRWSFLERHRVLFSTLMPVTAIAAVTANSLVAYNTNHPFRIHHEGFFGEDTVNGGADKASHLTDYYVIAGLFEDAYKMLGYSEKEAIL